MPAAISLPTKAIRAFCRKWGVRKLSLFGSVLREDFRPGSDVDVLVEFAPDRCPGFAIVAMEEELSRLLGGRRPDMVNPKYLNRRLKDRVLAEAEVVYEER